MCQLRTTFLVLLAACWLARDADSARNRLLDGHDPLGSPGELAWQAWLLMDASAAGGGAGGGAGSESTGARRITPKSVFIAPAFSPQSLPACAEGSKRDAAGRCVQLVHVNRDAQLSFLLQRLNALHARPPAPLRFPLPLPSRGGGGGGGGVAVAASSDTGPLKVALKVPPATAAPAPASTTSESTTATTTTTEATTTEATTTTTAPSTTASASTVPPSTSPTIPPLSKTPPPSPQNAPDPATQNDDEEPVRVSVVMADLTKRNSGEGERDGVEQEDGRPVITVWTIENDTLHKAHNAEGADSSFMVEIPNATEAASVGTEDKKPSAEQELLTSSDVLAPATVEGELPMLVISPGTTLAATPTTPRPQGEEDLGEEQVEGSGESPSEAETEVDPGAPKAGQLEEVEAFDGDMATSTEQVDDISETTMKENDEKETGSADVLEQIELVPISEHSRHNLPILGEDQDASLSQSALSDGLTGILHPIPLDVIPSSHSKEDSSYGNPVRFPSESSDEPHTVHLFKGNYIKFPTEHAFRYKHKPVTEPLTDVKQSFWWLPSGWRVEQQRHQPALQEFWSRMPLSEDSSLLSRYNPSYHSPLPYQQRQAQYDPEWATMKRQMSS